MSRRLRLQHQSTSAPLYGYFFVPLTVATLCTHDLPAFRLFLGPVPPILLCSALSSLCYTLENVGIANTVRATDREMSGI